MTETGSAAGTVAERGEAPRKKSGIAQRVLPWLIALVCFGYLYIRIAGAASREEMSFIEYLTGVFGGVSWSKWLMLMIPYSLLFFLIDTLVIWSAVRWFNDARLRYLDILPIRGSSYILSILNEQVGKGAMGLYLHRRYNVPGWEVGSSMIFVMFCEFYYLLIWATIGYFLRRSFLPAEFAAIPAVAAGALVFLVVFLLFFSGRIAFGQGLRERPLFKAFREAKLWHYGAIVLFRSPALLSAVVVYTLALRLFGIDVGFAQMLGYLPVIFFGAATPGPMRTVAITLWVVLFPGHEGEMAAFGFVQHNFFIFFNATFGLVFLRSANRALFDHQAKEQQPS